MNKRMQKTKNTASEQIRSSSDDQAFYAEVRVLLEKSRATTYSMVNIAMIETYWQVGQRIVEQEQRGKQRADYGDRLIVNLSSYLVDTFGKGFSVANLWNFKQFYQTFPDFAQFSTHCVGNLSWTHIRLIMRIETEAERTWYLCEAGEQNWSSRLLERNIKSGYYRRLLSSKKQIVLECEDATHKSVDEFIKDPYVLEFLDVQESLEGKESTLEGLLIGNLQRFLMELGKGFSFVGRQMRISTETSHFYIDLVFYNYLLKCFVIVDLKTTKLAHQDIGQMDMYVRMFDDLKRGIDDNPTLGIILCAEKDETIVKYSILKNSRHLFAAKYQTILPTEEELAELIATSNQQILSQRKDGGKQ